MCALVGVPIKFKVIITEMYPRIPWEVWGLLGYTVRGSNPGRVEIFCTRPDLPQNPPSLLYNVYLVILGGKAAVTWR